MSFSNDKSLFEIQYIPGLTVLTCPEMEAALETRLPDLPREVHVAIVNRHSEYITQATLLENEARHVEDKGASVAHHAAMLGCSDDTTVAEDVEMHHESAQILRQMRMCCVQKIRILETGTMDEISQFFDDHDSDRALLEDVCYRDPGIKETMIKAWPHLQFESIRMLRLQLIWGLIEKDRKAELLLQGLGMGLTGMDIDGKEKEEMTSLDLLMGKMKVEVGQEGHDEDAML